MTRGKLLPFLDRQRLQAFGPASYERECSIRGLVLSVSEPAAVQRYYYRPHLAASDRRGVFIGYGTTMTEREAVAVVERLQVGKALPTPAGPGCNRPGCKVCETLSALEKAEADQAAERTREARRKARRVDRGKSRELDTEWPKREKADACDYW